MTLFLDVYRWFAIAINVCSIVTCRPIGSGASIIYCIYVISVAIAYVTLIKKYLLTYLCCSVHLRYKNSGYFECIKGIYPVGANKENDHSLILAVTERNGGHS